MTTERSQKPIKAFAVLENDERTGDIYFARHAITARKAGAAEYGDGELSNVTCNRAPYADRFADTGTVPASVMVEHGWRFECQCCGHKIDEDLGERWRDRSHATLTDMLRQARRWRRWKPSMIVGNQHSQVFCDASCETAWKKEQAEKQRIGARVVDRFKAIVLRRFPDAEIVDDDDRWQRPHVYVTRNRQGRLAARQVVVSFRFPGMEYGPASLRWDHRSTYRGGKPEWSCCGGDKEAFEAFPREQRPLGNADSQRAEAA